MAPALVTAPGAQEGGVAPPRAQGDLRVWGLPVLCTPSEIVRAPQDSRAALFISRHRRTPSYPYDYRAHARRHTPPPEVGAGRMRKLRRGLAGEKHNTVFERPNQRPASPRQPMENPRVGQEGRSHYLNRARFKGSQSYFPAGVDDSRCARHGKQGLRGRRAAAEAQGQPPPLPEAHAAAAREGAVPTGPLAGARGQRSREDRVGDWSEEDSGGKGRWSLGAGGKERGR